MTWWHSGRVALFQAIGALGLRPGEAVAMPAFCCGSEVEPFVQAGLVPRFFRLTEALDPEPESFAAALDGAVAAVATHYLGFAADLDPVRGRCRAAGVPLIEDCAHALYSSDARGRLGEHSDMAIFSMGKTLPVPDGGALVDNVSTAIASRTRTRPPRRLVARRTRSLVIRHLQAHRSRPVSWAAHVPSMLKTSLGVSASRKPNLDTEAGLSEVGRFDRRLGDAMMSAGSCRLFGQTDHDHVRQARRRNYARVVGAVQEIPGLEPLFPSLPAGVCPLALPVVAKDPESFRRGLASGRGLGVRQMWPWFHPSVAWDAFPFEATLKRSVFIFPVHQSLTTEEVDFVVGTLRSWSQS